MEGMLTYAAVSAFHTSPDDLFTKAKNFFHVDYSASSTRKREYIQWDLDSAFTRSATLNIYNQTNSNDEYEDWIIGNSVFQPQYTNIMQTLLNGPFATAAMQADLSAFEALLADALAADPYALDGDTVEEHFDGFEEYLTDRHASVLGQLGP
jgi:spore coat protein CotH